MELPGVRSTIAFRQIDKTVEALSESSLAAPGDSSPQEACGFACLSPPHGNSASHPETQGHLAYSRHVYACLQDIKRGLCRQATLDAALEYSVPLFAAVSVATETGGLPVGFRFCTWDGKFLFGLSEKGSKHEALPSWSFRDHFDSVRAPTLSEIEALFRESQYESTVLKSSSGGSVSEPIAWGKGYPVGLDHATLQYSSILLKGGGSFWLTKGSPKRIELYLSGAVANAPSLGILHLIFPKGATLPSKEIKNVHLAPPAKSNGRDISLSEGIEELSVSKGEAESTACSGEAPEGASPP